MSSADDFGDRMKLYEGRESTSLLPRVPAMARLDGRGFHAFTKHAQRPFSEGFHRLMVKVAQHLVVESCADVGYTQSDEISLCWLETPFFDGKVQKMVSTLAAMASVWLHSLPREGEPGLAWNRLPTFDCRAWSVPNLDEATNVFLWRQMDASRNSVQMAARHHLGHAECDRLNTKELQEALFQKRGVNWNDYPAWCKRGTFLLHQKTQRLFTAAEIASLPEKHDARKNPGLVVERRVLREVDLDLRTLDERTEALFHL